MMIDFLPFIHYWLTELHFGFITSFILFILGLGVIAYSNAQEGETPDELFVFQLTMIIIVSVFAGFLFPLMCAIVYYGFLPTIVCIAVYKIATKQGQKAHQNKITKAQNEALVNKFLKDIEVNNGQEIEKLLATARSLNKK